VAAGALFLLAGCENAAPTTVDPSKTPWLDPQTQRNSLKNQDFRIRGLAAFHLGNMGAEAAEAIPELEKLAADDVNPKVRENAREALEKIRAARGLSSK
jgi:hypothetical protein